MNRKNFLKTIGAGSLGLALSPLSLLSDNSAKEERDVSIRLGLKCGATVIINDNSSFFFVNEPDSLELIDGKSKMLMDFILFKDELKVCENSVEKSREIVNSIDNYKEFGLVNISTLVKYKNGGGDHSFLNDSFSGYVPI